MKVGLGRGWDGSNFLEKKSTVNSFAAIYIQGCYCLDETDMIIVWEAASFDSRQNTASRVIPSYTALRCLITQISIKVYISNTYIYMEVT